MLQGLEELQLPFQNASIRADRPLHGFPEVLSALIVITIPHAFRWTAAGMCGCIVSTLSLGSVLSLQKAGWATPAPAPASSAWWSPRSTSGVWTTRAACSAAPSQVLGCAGRSLRTPSSRWQCRPQVGLLVPCLPSRCNRLAVPAATPVTQPTCLLPQV